MTRLARISLVARGIAKHGEPFARWVELARQANGRLGDFPERYLGRYACRRAYVAYVVDETARARGLLPATTPAQLRALYTVRFIARQWADTVVFADAEEGGVYAYASS